MISDVGSPDLPAKKWISLTSALTWLAFDRAIEAGHLASHAAQLSQVEQDRLLQVLSREWRKLADYACDGSVPVRAKLETGHFERALGVEEFRNHRHIGWISGNPPRLVLDRFPVTFAGAFRARAAKLCGGLLDPVASRREVIRYKQVLSRAKLKKYSLSKLKDAEAWLRDQLANIAPQTGLRDQYVDLLVDTFAIPKCRAAMIWREATTSWPKGGRPKGSKPSIKTV